MRLCVLYNDFGKNQEMVTCKGMHVILVHVYSNAFRNAPNYMYISFNYFKNQFPSYILVICLQPMSLYNTVLTFFLGVVEGLLDVILINVVDKEGARDELGNTPHHKAHPYHDPQAGARQVFKAHLWNITKKEHCIYETNCKSREIYNYLYLTSKLFPLIL